MLLSKKIRFQIKEGFKLESWEEGAKDYFVVIRPPLPVILRVREYLDDIGF